MIKPLKFILNRKTLEICYFSFIRPLIEYADVVWDNCTQRDKLELERIQYEAARIVTGCNRLVSIEDLLHECGWESLSDRRRKHKLILFFKMVNNLAPTFLTSLVPQTVGQTSSYRLRNQNNLQNTFARTATYASPFLPSVINEWNSLPLHVRNLTSLKLFKGHLNREINKANPLFYHGKRRLQVLHTRIRTNCSSLSYHLYHRQIIDSPVCLCGSVETAEHFFLRCALYNNIRPALLNTISNLSQVNINVILFGDNSKSLNTNKEIFRAVHSFIELSKRFDT